MRLSTNHENSMFNTTKPLSQSKFREATNKLADKSFLTSNSNKNYHSREFSEFDNKGDFDDYIKLQYYEMLTENESLKNKSNMMESSLKYLHEKINVKDRQILRLNEQLKSRQKLLTQLTVRYKYLKAYIKPSQQCKVQQDFMQFNKSHSKQMKSECKRQTDDLNEIESLLKKLQQQNLYQQQKILKLNQETEKYKLEQKLIQDHHKLQIQQVNLKLSLIQKQRDTFDKICKKLQQQKYEYQTMNQQKTKIIQRNSEQIQILKQEISLLRREFESQSDKMKSHTKQLSEFDNQFRLEKVIMENQIKHLKYRANHQENSINQNLLNLFSRSINQFQIVQSIQSQSDETSPKRKNSPGIGKLSQRKKYETAQKYQEEEQDESQQKSQRRVGEIRTFKGSSQNRSKAKISKFKNRI